jgi:hypothetical protein
MFEQYALVMLLAFAMVTIATLVWGVVQILSVIAEIEKGIAAIQASSRDQHAVLERLLRMADATLETARATLLAVHTQSPTQ